MRFRFAPPILVLLLAFSGSLQGGTEELLLRKAPLAPKSSWGGKAMFQALSGSEVGVSMSYDFDPGHPLNRLYPYGWATGNCAIGDLDGDGRADLFFPGTTSGHRVFLQKNGFRFEEATPDNVGGNPEIWGSAAVMGDVDRDGDLDVYVVNFGSPNQLFMNISRPGSVRFTEMGEEYGVALESGCLGASFVDYNLDGWLDLFVQTYHFEPEKGRPSRVKVMRDGGFARVEEKWEQSYIGYLDREKKPRWVEAGLSDVMLINNRSGGFVFQYSGMALGRSYGVSHVWWDLDGDSRPDLYTGNDHHDPDVFYRQARIGKLAEIGRASIPCTPWFARGATAADFDGDLRMDLFSANRGHLSYRDRLVYGEPFPREIYRNLTSGGVRQVARNVFLGSTGTSRFEELAGLAGLANTGAVWAVKSGDYDCDGMIDLFLATGEARDWTKLPSEKLVGEHLKGKTRWDLLKDLPENRQKDFAFRNRGDWRFEDVSREWGLDHLGMSYCAGQGDLDGDGDLDLVVCRLGEEITIYRNHCQNPRLVLDFKGDRTNSRGIGVELLGVTGRGGFLRQLYPTGGFKSSDEPAVHLGLGSDDSVGRVSVRWPVSGLVGTFAGLESGFRYTVKEGSTSLASVERLGHRPLFRGISTMKGLGYTEAAFNPAQTQPMVPEHLSIAGPGVAASDLDGDGLSEIYFSGAKGKPGKLLARSPGLMRFGQPFGRMREPEESAAVFFDADGDGDLDLYVGSGGVEFSGDGKWLRDRLYLNLGGGKMEASREDSLPAAEEITGAVAAADFDRDGDLDLFVGSRMKKNHYPLPGRNQLLSNEGSARFRSAIDAAAPGLAETGMVTGAIWTDANGDGWLDLMLTHDWGAPQLWINRKGVLSDFSRQAGLEGLTGRWNGISGRDIDGDGDIDYLLGNWGTNEADGATHVFTRTFPDSEWPAVVMAREDGGRLWPVKNWSQWAGIESIRSSVTSPAEFVEKADSILGISSDAGAHASVREPRSGVLINDGAAKFRFLPLPVEAQVAPVFGSILTDFNFDGKCDAFVMHNEVPASIRNPDPGANGVSCLLLGTGDPEEPFRALASDVSGLILFGLGRAAVVTDLNADGRADLVCSMNGSDPAAFLNYEPATRFQPLKVQLDFTGKPVPGARVTVSIPGFPDQTAEYHAGSGYLSQSSADLFFGAPATPEGPARITIRWSDGSETLRTYYFDWD